MYECIIPSQNSWVEHDGGACTIHEARCKHQHKTIKAALRCLNSLSRYFKDGSHNGWAHFGQIAEIKSCNHYNLLKGYEDYDPDMLQRKSGAYCEKNA